MNSHRQTFTHSLTRSLAALAVGASLWIVVPPAQSAAPDEGAPERMQERMREHLQSRLDRLARRLELTASQQSAWSSYVAAVLTPAGAWPQRPGSDADAATLLRFRAELASLHAQKLARVADATAKLQEALSPEQRQVLASAVRKTGWRGGGRPHHAWPGADG